MPDAGSVDSVIRNISFSHGPGTDEQDLVEHTAITEIDYHHFDLSTLSQVNETTIRAYEKTDGITYRLLSTKVFPTDYDPGVQTIVIVLNGGGKDMKITFQSAVDEGSTKTIKGTVRDDLRL